MNNRLSYDYVKILCSKTNESNPVIKSILCLSRKPFDILESERHIFLHHKEKISYEKIIHQKRKNSFLLGRYVAKIAIKELINEINLNSIYIDEGIFHQPRVNAGVGYNNIQVSISHSDEYGAALSFFDGNLMGIDIETICHNKIMACKSQFEPTEKNLSKNLFESESIQFTVLWTIKEALSKALKCGLTIPFAILEIKDFKKKGNFIISYFKNFPQYKAVSFLFSNVACSFVGPINLNLNLDMDFTNILN